MNETAITRLMERLGQSLSSGKLEDAAACWQTPAFVLADAGATALADAAQLQQLFAQAAEGYRARGLVATRPEIQQLEELSEDLVSVDVRWPAFDAAGVEQHSERSRYLVQFGKDGEARIRVALTRSP